MDKDTINLNRETGEVTVTVTLTLSEIERLLNGLGTLEDNEFESTLDRVALYKRFLGIKSGMNARPPGE